MYPILQECFFFTNKNSGCACLHGVSIPESQSEQVDPIHAISDMVFTNEQERKARLAH